jgi:Na+-driven multidrug efflux pump
MNLIIGAFSTTAIAVYGSYFKLNSFIFMPVFGLNSGVVPIIAYNYGAKNKERIYRAVFLSIISASTIMLVGATIFELFPHILLGLFSASDSMLAIGVPALRLIAPSFIGAAIAISLSNVFQAFGKAVYSMTVSLIRQIFVLLPVAYLFSLTGNLNMVWLCFPIAEVVALTLSILYYRRINRKIISKL